MVHNLSGSEAGDTVAFTEGTVDAFGGGGDDTMIGGDFDDTQSGGDGVDCIVGGDGNDSIEGNADGDTVHGGDGDDTIYGGEGDDTIDGGEGADALYGGEGDDLVLGSGGNNPGSQEFEGDDTLVGGTGSDTLQGGGGDDLYVYNAGDGTDLILDQWLYNAYTPFGLYLGTRDYDAGDDTLAFGDGLSIDNVTLGFIGNDLYAAVLEPGVDFEDSTDLIRMQDWGDAVNEIESFEFLDGGQIFDSEIIRPLLEAGGGADNLISFSDLGYYVDAGAGEDTVTGSSFADALEGGTGTIC